MSDIQPVWLLCNVRPLCQIACVGGVTTISWTLMTKPDLPFQQCCFRMRRFPYSPSKPGMCNGIHLNSKRWLMENLYCRYDLYAICPRLNKEYNKVFPLKYLFFFNKGLTPSGLIHIQKYYAWVLLCEIHCFKYSFNFISNQKFLDVSDYNIYIHLGDLCFNDIFHVLTQL